MSKQRLQQSWVIALAVLMSWGAAAEPSEPIPVKVVVVTMFEVGADEQSKRFEGRMTDPRKHWKLSPMDLEGQSKWYDYSRAKDAMFMATDTTWAPWNVVNSNDKKRARLNCISHLLSQFPYEEFPYEKPELSPRQSSDGYQVPDYDYNYAPQKF